MSVESWRKRINEKLAQTSKERRRALQQDFEKYGVNCDKEVMVELAKKHGLTFRKIY